MNKLYYTNNIIIFTMILSMIFINVWILTTFFVYLCDFHRFIYFSTFLLFFWKTYFLFISIWFFCWWEIWGKCDLSTPSPPKLTFVACRTFHIMWYKAKYNTNMHKNFKWSYLKKYIKSRIQWHFSWTVHNNYDK